MEKDADVLGRYRNISNKLKKRFLKKPNVGECSEQFGSIARSLENQEANQYAGFFHLAQARCEHTMVNGVGEAEALMKAARAFLHEEERCNNLKCVSFQENLDAAINCYSHAVRVHIENKNPMLAGNLCLELGHAYMRFGRPGEAMLEFQRAAELHSQNGVACLTAKGYAATCKIETKEYEGALTLLTEMSYMAQELSGGSRPVGFYCDVMARCEVTRVLLLLLLQPTPQRIRPEHAQTLEKYAWESTEEGSPVPCISEDLFLLLQSVVMACQSKEMECLHSLQIELWKYLSPEQNQLLHLVIQELEHPLGEGF